MNDSIKIPAWFYLVAVIAIVWNALGVMAYLSTVSSMFNEMMPMSETDQIMHDLMPIWAKGAFGIAVFGGLLGSLLLLLKNSLALPLFIASLLGITIQNINAYIMGSFAVFGPGTYMVIMVVVFAIILVFLAKHAIKLKWIK